MGGSVGQATYVDLNSKGAKNISTCLFIHSFSGDVHYIFIYLFIFDYLCIYLLVCLFVIYLFITLFFTLYLYFLFIYL
jgi:hypothetical protein